MSKIYGIKDAANLYINKKTDGKPFLYTPYSNVTTNEWSADEVEAKAKGVKAIVWHHNKQSTLQVEAETFDLKWLAMQAGSDWVEGAAEILRREVLEVKKVSTDFKVSLNATPVKDSVSVYKTGSDNVSIEEEISGTTVATKDITLTGVTEGQKVTVFYLESVANVKTLTFAADKYPENYEVVGDVMITPKDGGKPEFVQMKWGNVKPKNNFSITLDAGSATNLSITFDVLPDENNEMATYKHIA